jgi:hypothetical protein
MVFILFCYITNLLFENDYQVIFESLANSGMIQERLTDNKL